MDSKQQLINKINERLRAVSRKEADIERHNKRFVTEVAALINTIEQDLQDVPAVSTTRDPLATTDSLPFTKFSISLFDQSVDLTPIEQEGKLALQLESVGYDPVIFKLDMLGRWLFPRQGLTDLQLTTAVIHNRLSRIVELKTTVPAQPKMHGAEI